MCFFSTFLSCFRPCPPRRCPLGVHMAPLDPHDLLVFVAFALHCPFWSNQGLPWDLQGGLVCPSPWRFSRAMCPFGRTKADVRGTCARFGRQLVPLPCSLQSTSEDPPRSAPAPPGECPRVPQSSVLVFARALQSVLEHPRAPPSDIVLDAVRRGARGVGSFRCGVEMQGRVSRLRCCADGR